MKKALCTLLALVMVLGCAFALAACSKDEGGKENKTPAIPAGYQKFTIEDIAFAYPEGWQKQDGSVTMLVNASGQGNNITVVYTAKDSTFDNMTVEKFNTDIKPSYEAAGLSVSNASVETVKSNGLSVLKISYTAVVSGVSMEQTQYVVNVGSKTYAITVTEVTPDATLVSTVLDTLHKAK